MDSLTATAIGNPAGYNCKIEFEVVLPFPERETR